MLLSLAIWIPMVAGVLVLVLGGRYARWTALVCSILGFLITLPLYWSFDASSSAMQFVEFGRWIERFNVNYHLGVDGISVLFVLLNSFIRAGGDRQLVAGRQPGGAVLRRVPDPLRHA